MADSSHSPHETRGVRTATRAARNPSVVQLVSSESIKRNRPLSRKPAEQSSKRLPTAAPTLPTSRRPSRNVEKTVISDASAGMR